MKPGDKVQTIHGPGILQGKETYSRIKTFRYGVILEGEKYVKYYWPHEIKSCQ